MLLQFGKTIAVPGHKVRVMEAIADDHVEHRQQKRAIGAGPELEEPAGALRRLSPSRIDDYHLLRRAQCFPDRAGAKAVGGAEFEGIVPDDQERLRHDPVGPCRSGWGSHPTVRADEIFLGRKQL